MIGRTENPCSSIRNGYSFVPCAVPRYLTRQPPCRHLLRHPVVEENHAIRDVFLQALAGQRPVAALGGDDRGDPLVLEPAEQPPQLGAQDRLVREAAEQRLDRVEDDPLRLDRVDRVTEADEQAVEVVLAVLLDLGAFDDDVIDEQLLLLGQLVEVEAQRPDVRAQLVGCLLECDEHAGLTLVDRAADQEFHRQQRLATAGAAADEGGSTPREAAARDLIQPLDPGGGLGQFGGDPFAVGLGHRNP